MLRIESRDTSYPSQTLRGSFCNGWWLVFFMAS